MTKSFHMYSGPEGTSLFTKMYTTKILCSAFLKLVLGRRQHKTKNITYSEKLARILNNNLILIRNEVKLEFEWCVPSPLESNS